MKKEDLKALYVVELREGGKHIIIHKESYYYPDTLFLYKPGSIGSQQMQDYDENLTMNDYFNLDIMKVWGYSSEPNEVLTTNVDHRELLWTRKVIRELTITEIEKILGFNIKVVK